MKSNSKCRAVLATILLACVTLPVHASVWFDFGVSLAGLGTYQGSFSIDSTTGTGTELYWPMGGAPGMTLESFDITIDGQAFTMENDDNYPYSPYVVFVDGLITEMFFLGLAGPNAILDISFIDGVYNIVQYVSQEGGEYEGAVTFPSIPEPATLALFGLGLAVIPFVRRRRTPA